jgi:hypothetical protein
MLEAFHPKADTSGYQVPPNPCASAKLWHVDRIPSNPPQAFGRPWEEDTKIVRSSFEFFHEGFQLGVGVAVGVAVGTTP